MCDSLKIEISCEKLYRVEKTLSEGFYKLSNFMIIDPSQFPWFLLRKIYRQAGADPGGLVIGFPCVWGWNHRKDFTYHALSFSGSTLFLQDNILFHLRTLTQQIQIEWHCLVKHVAGCRCWTMGHAQGLLGKLLILFQWFPSSWGKMVLPPSPFDLIPLSLARKHRTFYIYTHAITKHLPVLHNFNRFATYSD